jgi:hypothetical protein
MWIVSETVYNNRRNRFLLVSTATSKDERTEDSSEQIASRPACRRLAAPCARRLLLLRGVKIARQESVLPVSLTSLEQKLSKHRVSVWKQKDLRATLKA